MSFSTTIASLMRFDLEGALTDPVQLGALLDLTAILKGLRASSAGSRRYAPSAGRGDSRMEFGAARRQSLR
jgi:hypothetical protein